MPNVFVQETPSVRTDQFRNHSSHFSVRLQQMTGLPVPISRFGDPVTHGGSKVPKLRDFGVLSDSNPYIVYLTICVQR